MSRRGSTSLIMATAVCTVVALAAGCSAPHTWRWDTCEGYKTVDLRGC